MSYLQNKLNRVVEATERYYNALKEEQNQDHPGAWAETDKMFVMIVDKERAGDFVGRIKSMMGD